MFGWLINIFNTVLYVPLFNALIWLYNVIPGHDFGVAVILLTILIRIILSPIFVRSIESQKILQKLQPKVQEIQKKFKDDKERQAKEMLDLYKQEKINPFSGALLALVQLPVLIALYTVFWHGTDPSQLQNLYSFIANPGQIDFTLFSLIDLSKPNLILAATAGILQFFQTKMMLVKSTGDKKEGDFSVILQKQMTYVFPFVTILILFNLPSALGLYWTVSGIFSIVQQHVILKKHA